MELTTEADYNRLVALLDELIDEVSEDKAHPLGSLMDILGVKNEHYVSANFAELI